MKIIFPNGTELDTPKAVGSALVAGGLAKEVPAVPQQFVPLLPCTAEARWRIVGEALLIQVTEGTETTSRRSRQTAQPRIGVVCDCNPKQDLMFSGATAPKKSKFFHRGGRIETPPSDIAKRFFKAYKAYVDEALR